ncbi:hypothetical protein RMR16_024390 (plasmid) [Agrobacterium sp. rho-13.3]|uniref:hypothetical protein n=1 Tax=Agrobacterium sp. rho-13.3 TaxID=3072980 RepID=UPI002A175819|nr:hypothetical protein [Agrobacterium sp. rho-13.3]MDX8311951.1 hypothetical protein [Agrobacterium sp. rho-13.3]
MSIDFTIIREGREFYCKANGGTKFYVGRQVSYQGRVGLKNDHDASITKVKYDPTNYPEFGFWAQFLAPTAQAESRSSFIVLNTYDRAAFTFGAFQFAAHVPNGDFVKFLRSMLERAEAEEYFPNLVVENRRICSVELMTEVQLEDDNSTQKLQKYLNQADEIVDDREIIAAAKLIHWTTHHIEVRQLQVHHCVSVAQQYMDRLDRRLNLDNRTAGECCVAFDILHHGRGGSNTFPTLQRALASTKPLDKLLEIGEEQYAERIRTLRAGLKAEPGFASKKWSTEHRDFQ